MTQKTKEQIEKIESSSLPMGLQIEEIIMATLREAVLSGKFPECPCCGKPIMPTN